MGYGLDGRGSIPDEGKRLFVPNSRKDEKKMRSLLSSFGRLRQK
jgi:hypothetical protein